MKMIKKIVSVVLTVSVILSLFATTSFAVSKKLDLAFVIDTTSSMSDDINEVKENMSIYLNDLSDSGMDFRIAIIDYRDFAEYTGYYDDYPYSVKLDFTSDYDKILSSINSLSLGSGGDERETICSALIDGLDELSWRETAGKTAILMGDAPAHDPEPYTGYTKAMAVSKLKYDSTAYEEIIVDRSVSASKSGSDSSVYAEPLFKRNEVSASESVRSGITLFTIATSTKSSVISDYEYLAQQTGGKCYSAITDEEIDETIKEIIEIVPEIVDQPSVVKPIVEKIFDFLTRFFKMIFSTISKLIVLATAMVD